jgi:UDP-glucose 4-epimerase
MKCLVTGGCGFIGSNLVTHLTNRGHTVVVLDDLSTGLRGSIPPNVGFCQGSIVDRRRVDAAISGCSVVFHLAASVGNARSLLNPLRDTEVNVQGTINVLEAARRAEVQRVVYSSSAAIFGEPQYLPLDEQHPCEPDSPYGCSKLCAEKLCLAYSRLYGLSTVCLRYFNVYGRGQRYDAYGNVLPVFAERMHRHEPLTVYGDGSQTRDFVNVQDVVRANYRAATVPDACGAYNIGSGQATSVNDLVKILEAPSVQYSLHRAGDVRYSLADISKAQREIGYTPSVDIAEGIRAYLVWFNA